MSHSLSRKTFAWIPALFALSAALGTGQDRSEGVPKAQVILFVSSECPITAMYASRINSLVHDFEAKGVGFLAVFPQPGDTKAEADAVMRQRGHAFAVRMDPDQILAQKYAVDRVPDVIVLDSRGKVIYKGGIDSSPSLDRKPEPWVRSTLDLVATGKDPGVVFHQAPGCLLEKQTAMPKWSADDFEAYVRPIFAMHCDDCHMRTTLPVKFPGLEEAVRWRRMIADSLTNRTMPPVPESRQSSGHFAHRPLTDAERSMVVRWCSGEKLSGPKPQPYLMQDSPRPNFGGSYQSPYQVNRSSGFGLTMETLRFFVNPKDIGWAAGFGFNSGQDAQVRSADVIVKTGNRKVWLGTWQLGDIGWAASDKYGAKLSTDSVLILQVTYADLGFPISDRPGITLVRSSEPLQEPELVEASMRPDSTVEAGMSISGTARINLPFDGKLVRFKPQMRMGISQLLISHRAAGHESIIADTARWQYRFPQSLEFVEGIPVKQGVPLFLQSKFEKLRAVGPYPELDGKFWFGVVRN